MSLLALPLEIILEIAALCELSAYVSLGRCCRLLREALQAEKLAWLAANLPKKKRERPASPTTAAVLKSSRKATLGHALQHMVIKHGTSRPFTQELLAAGASFGHVGCGEFLEREFLTHGASIRLKFAVAHGGDLRSVPRSLPALLEDTVQNHFRDARADWLLKFIPLEEIPGGLDRYIARWLERTGPTQRTDFLISRGAKPPDNASYMNSIYAKWGPSELVYKHFTMDGFPLTEERIGELLLWALGKWRHRELIENILAQDVSWSVIPGGVNAALEHTLRERMKFSSSAVELLQEHGASLDHLPCGMTQLLKDLLEDESCVHVVEFLVEQGESLERIPNGWPRFLRMSFLANGSSPILDYIEQHHGVSLDRATGGLNGLLEEILLNGSWIHHSNVLDYLVQRGADPSSLPDINSMLEKVYRKEGRGYRCDFLVRHGAKFKEVPSGLEALLYDTLRNSWRASDWDFLVAQGAEPQKLPKGLRGTLNEFLRKSNPSAPEVVWLRAQVRAVRTAETLHP